jgi:predicted  nucleic acid-binding Zn-ribbon protein
MTSVNKGLQELHRNLVAIEEFENELARGPKRIAASEKKLGAKDSEIAIQKELITNLRKSADQKTLQLKSNEARMIGLKVKLNEAKSNREYNIIKGQIDADTMANSVFEDEILEALETIDTANSRLQELKEELADAIEKKQSIEATVAKNRPGLESSLAAAQESLLVAESIMPGKHKEQYRRMMTAHGAGALFPVDDGYCSNCYGMLSPQEKVQLNTEQVIFCRACGRIMFHPA